MYDLARVVALFAPGLVFRISLSPKRSGEGTKEAAQALLAILTSAGGLWFVDEDGFAITGIEGNQADDRLGSGVRQVVSNADGNSEGHPGPKVDDVVFKTVLPGSGKHVQHFFTVGVIMSWIPATRLDVAKTERLLGPAKQSSMA